jgi:DNA topoisomerase-2
MQVSKAKAAGEKVVKVSKAKKVPLQSRSGFNVAANEVEEKVAKPIKREPHTDKSIGETYRKKTQLEHSLLRPDTYVRSIEKRTQTLWVYEDEEMVSRSVTFVPGLYKIFDEILVNAADNKLHDPSVDTVKVSSVALVISAFAVPLSV